jgi:hypothetical protein
MIESPSLPLNCSAPDDDPLLKKRAAAHGWGFLSILLGIFSLLSLFGQTWWICGGLGFLGCTLIMIHLNRHQTSSVVRSMTAGGLCMSLLIISYAPTHYYLREDAIARQAALFGNDWIKNILAGKPFKALATLKNPETRLAEKQLKTFYLKTTEGRQELAQFKEKLLVKSLLRLDGRARSQFYDTESSRVQGRTQIITNLFSVSYLETPLKKKTFFIRLVLKRSVMETGKGGWSVLRYRGGVRPREGRYSKKAAVADHS